jgi:hypothetical protein
MRTHISRYSRNACKCEWKPTTVNRSTESAPTSWTLVDQVACTQTHPVQDCRLTAQLARTEEAAKRALLWHDPHAKRSLAKRVLELEKELATLLASKFAAEGLAPSIRLPFTYVCCNMHRDGGKICMVIVSTAVMGCMLRSQARKGTPFYYEGQGKG